MQEESGWLIEQWIHGQLMYWSGRSTDDVAFTPKVEDAIRFSRHQDASKIISWLLNGRGRAAEHAFVGPYPTPGKGE